MNRSTISLGRILGIRINLDYSWFLIFALLTWALAVSYYPSEFKNWPTGQYWMMGAVTAVMLFVSVLIHELGHSLVAKHYHIPVRSITLFIFGGVSEMATEPPNATTEFWIAVVGPLISFALAGIFFLSQPIVAGVAPLAALTKYLALINGALGVFNLIPGFPLDGGRVFRALVRGFTHNFRRATLIAASVGRLIAFLFIGLGVWQIFIGNLINGVWIAFIGWFLDSAAMAQVQQQAMHDLLSGHKVSEAMSHRYVSVPAGATLQQLVDQQILAQGRRSFVVQTSNEVAGLLTLHHVKEVPRTEWPTTKVIQAMIPAAHMKRIRPDAELWAALEEMDRDGVNELPVITNGHIEGMLSREDVMSFLRTMKEFAA